MIIEINQKELATLLLQSFRYCLGRMTCAVSVCTEILIKYWHILPPHFQQMIREETRHAIEHDYAGDRCDVENWEEFLRKTIGKEKV